MPYRDLALKFACAGEPLFGILSLPFRPAKRGVVVVVGGPQYRGGSHRQFTLLARALAADGFAVLRFDYRGMGDSGGDKRDFEMIDDDLRAAIDQMFLTVPGLDDVVIWGLCDGASAAMMYAEHDARVSGLVLLNPWARSEHGLAKATLKHYYRARLFDAGLWKKILLLRFDYIDALRSLMKQVVSVAKRAPARNAASATAVAPQTFHMRMLAGLTRFGGKVLLITSGRDLTAREFLEMAAADSQWRGLLAASRVARHDLAAADHTFSSRLWRDQVASWTGQWLRSW